MPRHPSSPARGERVFLREPTPADRDELTRLGSVSRALHHPWLSAPATAKAVDEWLARARSDRAASYVVCRHEDGAIVGVFNLSEIVWGHFRSCYSSYYAHAAHAGHGYMSEGLELLLRHAFRSLRLHRIEANIQPGNTPSIALVRRAGFRLEGHSPRYLKIGGRWRDHQRWAITREDWSARRTRRSDTSYQPSALSDRPSPARRRASGPPAS
jgi:ribosomal-protein-alanine N-acetyltransferase